jgi:hypothetical protein
MTPAPHSGIAAPTRKDGHCPHSNLANNRFASYHWYRNIFSHVPSTKVREIAAMLKAIHASEDIAAAREKATRV